MYSIPYYIYDYICQGLPTPTILDGWTCMAIGFFDSPVPGLLATGTFGQRFTSYSHWSAAYHDNSSFRGSSADEKIYERVNLFSWSSVLRAFLLGIFAKGSRPKIIKSALPVLSYTYTNAIMRYMSNMSKNYHPFSCRPWPNRTIIPSLGNLCSVRWANGPDVAGTLRYLPLLPRLGKIHEKSTIPSKI